MTIAEIILPIAFTPHAQNQQNFHPTSQILVFFVPVNASMACTPPLENVVKVDATSDAEYNAPSFTEQIRSLRKLTLINGVLGFFGRVIDGSHAFVVNQRLQTKAFMVICD